MTPDRLLKIMSELKPHEIPIVLNGLESRCHALKLHRTAGLLNKWPKQEVGFELGEVISGQPRTEATEHYLDVRRDDAD